MPPAPKHNWNYLYEVYQEFLKDNPGTAVAEFARQNGVDEGACRAAFNRIEKKRNKRTIRTENGRTDGRKKPGIFDDVSHEEAIEVIKQVSDARVVAAHAKVLTVLCVELNNIEDLQKIRVEKDEAGKNKIKIETQSDLRQAVQTSNEIIRACREILPFILELKDRAGFEAVLSKLQGREYDVTQAALEISKMGANLPEALKIMLAKVPPIVIANNFEAPDGDEMDKRALEAIQHVQWQYETFLPQRRQEVIELKQELKGVDSFAPEEKKERLKTKTGDES